MPISAKLYNELERRYADLEALYAIARQETERFRTDATDKTTALEECRERVRQANDFKNEAQAEAKELRERLDELKSKYADCRYQNAVMNGYLDRVYEDDVVREGMVEVSTGTAPAEKTLQPKRPPRPQFPDVERHGSIASPGEFDRLFTKSRRPDHWAKY